MIFKSTKANHLEFAPSLRSFLHIIFYLFSFYIFSLFTLTMKDETTFLARFLQFSM